MRIFTKKFTKKKLATNIKLFLNLFAAFMSYTMVANAIHEIH